MSISESWTPSRRMRSAASAELERVERELLRIDERERELAEGLATLGGMRAELTEQLVVLRRFADEPSEPDESPRRLRVLHGGESAGATLAATPASHELRGARIREVAVQVLSRTPEGRAPIHYKTWYELLRARGFMPAGKDPLASFLTQIGRSPVVRRSSAAGTYTLDVEFPTRAREELASLREQFQSAARLPANATIAEIADARARRSELGAAVDTVERMLEEAVRSFQSPPT